MAWAVERYHDAWNRVTRQTAERMLEVLAVAPAVTSSMLHQAGNIAEAE